MKLKRYLHLILFLSLLLFLPVMLVMVDAKNPDSARYTIDGEGGLPEECDLERANYYALFYEHEKSKVVFSSKNPGEELDAEKGPAGKEEQPAAQPSAGSSSSSSSQVAAGTTGTSSSLNSKEQEMLNLVNQARSNAGLSQLQVCSELTRAARAKSKDMVDNNYFSHTSPRYGGLEGLLSNFGIGYRSAGENLAMNSSGSVSAAHNSLMSSPGHRDNILGSSYNYVGIGIHVKSDGSHYYTQLFVGR